MTDPQIPGRQPRESPHGMEPALPGRAAAPPPGLPIPREPVTIDDDLLEHVCRLGWNWDFVFPRRHKLRAGFFLLLQTAFEPGRQYDEAEAAILMRRLAPRLDGSTARCYMIDYGMLDRFADGTGYWVSQRFRTFISISPDLEGRLGGFAERLAMSWRDATWW